MSMKNLIWIAHRLDRVTIYHAAKSLIIFSTVEALWSFLRTYHGRTDGLIESQPFNRSARSSFLLVVQYCILYFKEHIFWILAIIDTVNRFKSIENKFFCEEMKFTAILHIILPNYRFLYNSKFILAAISLDTKCCR